MEESGYTIQDRGVMLYEVNYSWKKMGDANETADKLFRPFLLNGWFLDEVVLCEFFGDDSWDD